MSELKHKPGSEEKMAALPILGKPPESPKEEKYLREICEYEFYNLEEPGLTHRFSCGSTVNQMSFTLFHSGKYRVPRFIARHIESRSTPLWDWRPDGSGRMAKKQVGTKPRFRMSVTFT